MKERWFNYRPICLVCAFLLLGSVFSFYLSNNTALVAIIACIIATFLLIIAICKKKLKYFGVPLTAFIIGVFAYNIAVITFNKTIEFKPTQIEARITSLGKVYENEYIKIQADDCVFDNEKVDDNIYIIIYGDETSLQTLEIGQKLCFETKSFKKNDLFYNTTPNAKLFADDIKYTAIVQFSDISFGEIDKTFAETIRADIKENLSLSLTKSNVELAYSSLFGDKTMLANEHQQAFKLSGVAHLLAVSGLHVGIIVMVLTFLLKPLKHKKWLSFFLISAILLFYMYLCDFSISVIRAVIMTIVLLISKLLNEEYDIFNSIAIAGIVIFLINPLCIFDVSFLMSFSCVLGIAMLYKPISLALQKIRIHRKIVSSLAMSLSTTIALIMIMAFYFKNFNAISIFANVILIPLFTIAFIPIFIFAFASTILSYATYALFPINYLLDFITFVANALGNTALSNFGTMPVNYISILIYFIFIVLIGRLCSAKSQYKVIISLPTLALLFYSLL